MVRPDCLSAIFPPVYNAKLTLRNVGNIFCLSLRVTFSKVYQQRAQTNKKSTLSDALYTVFGVSYLTIENRNITQNSRVAEF